MNKLLDSETFISFSDLANLLEDKNNINNSFFELIDIINSESQNIKELEKTINIAKQAEKNAYDSLVYMTTLLKPENGTLCFVKDNYVYSFDSIKKEISKIKITQ